MHVNFQKSEIKTGKNLWTKKNCVLNKNETINKLLSLAMSNPHICRNQHTHVDKLMTAKLARMLFTVHSDFLFVYIRRHVYVSIEMLFLYLRWQHYDWADETNTLNSCFRPIVYIWKKKGNQQKCNVWFFVREEERVREKHSCVILHALQFFARNIHIPCMCMCVVEWNTND